MLGRSRVQMSEKQGQIVRWVVSKIEWHERPKEWQLMVAAPGREKIPAATVFRNDDDGSGVFSATWHTWDIDGNGGQNWVQKAPTSDEACLLARRAAAAAAIEQCFV